MSRRYPGYLKICIGYRIITLILSIFVYLILSLFFYQTRPNWGIILGMLLSCLLSTWIYIKINNNSFWMRIMFLLETFAYGIFTILSGGFESPFLWYQLSSLLLMIALEKHLLPSLVNSIWCISCAILGNRDSSLCSQELNIALAMIIILGGFYILRFHIYYIENQKEELLSLNNSLEKETYQNEYAFLQLAALYETFHLFAMTNPEKILRELTLILFRTIAPSGCLLIKLDFRGQIEMVEKCQIEDALARTIAGEIDSYIQNSQLQELENLNYKLKTGDGIFEATLLGENLCYKGVLVRKINNTKHANEVFYLKLIEIIFSNLDSHSQMEHFIALEEQNRIANEIHDTVIQKLFGMVCKLKVLETKTMQVEKDELMKEINALKRSLELTMAELRESIYGSRFNSSIHTFSESLSLYMEEAQNLSGVPIDLHIDASAGLMTSAQKIALYRIGCEAVNNAIRHGKAHHINIILQLNAEQILLQVEDDGSGLIKHNNSIYEGNGLKNMHNIAALLKGSLVLESDLGQGTKVTCVLPR